MARASCRPERHPRLLPGLTPAGFLELLRLHHEHARTLSATLVGWADEKARTPTGLLDELGTALAAATHPHHPTHFGGATSVQAIVRPAYAQGHHVRSLRPT